MSLLRYPVATPTTGPAFTYTSGLLTSVAYDNGESKTITYNAGKVSQVDFIQNGATIRKSFTYTNGVLTSISQAVL